MVGLSCRVQRKQSDLIALEVLKMGSALQYVIQVLRHLMAFSGLATVFLLMLPGKH